MSDHAHAGTHDKHAAHQRLVDRLRGQGAEIERLTRGLDDASLSERTTPDKWSVKELVCHLWRVQRLFDERIQAMLTTDDPVLLPYSPDSDSDFDKLVAHDATETRDAFLADRERFAARLAELTPAAWHRSGRHPEYPRFDVHFQVEYMVHHEAHHIYQLFQRRLPLGKLPH
jgi:uncharacterized protein (TIGR03083 family)